MPQTKKRAAEYRGERRAARKVYAKEYRQRPHAKEKASVSRMESLYGITRGTYDAMLRGQDGVCALCGTKDPGQGATFFCVDHDHHTGAVRGLLCKACNRGLGCFGDDHLRLARAAAYVRDGAVFS